MKDLVARLDKEGAAYDIATYRDAPPACASGAARRWRRADLEALTPWLDWAFAEAKAALPKAA